MALINCPECGKEISDRAAACPNCGCPVEIAQPVQKTDEREEVPHRFEAQEKVAKRKRVLLVGGAVLFFVVLFVGAAVSGVVSRSPKHDLHNLTGIIKGGDTCVIAEDGKSMKVDTNPDNVSGKNYGSVLADIQTINEQLGLPSSLIDKMEGTRALDGRQEETYGKVAVSWTYHPDSGLEVLYELK